MTDCKRFFEAVLYMRINRKIHAVSFKVVFIRDRVERGGMKELSGSREVLLEKKILDHCLLHDSRFSLYE